MSTQSTPRRTVKLRRQETYKHLDDPLRPGGLTLAQWAAVVITALAAVVFGLYVSPFSTGITISLSILFAGLPAAISYAAGGFDLSPLDALRSVWHWNREAKHYVPSACVVAAGYVVLAAQRPGGTRDRSQPVDPASTRRRLEEAWDR
jgi:hypothetical protein